MNRNANQITMGNRTTPSAEPIPGPYLYHRDAEGLNDLWAIRSVVEDQYVATVYFWEQPRKSDAAVSESTARLLCAAPLLRDNLKALLDAIAALPCDLPCGTYATVVSAEELLALIEGTPPS